MDTQLDGKRALVTGASSGLGRAIAEAMAADGATIAVHARSEEKAKDTLDTIAKAGGNAFAVTGDMATTGEIEAMCKTALDKLGGIDIVVNNASAIATEPTENLTAKKFDLMMDINVRGTFLLTKAALPHLRRSATRTQGANQAPHTQGAEAAAHVMTLAPPLNLNPHWLGAHPSYTLSKYGMTLLSMGWAAEYRDAGIAFSCLWPQTYIATSAVSNLADGDDLVKASRCPDIMADAAVEILGKPVAEANGQCYIDADVLTAAGMTDLSRYGGGDDPMWDIFVDKS